MKVKSIALMLLLAATTTFTTNTFVDAKPATPAAPKAKTFPKVMTGLDTNVSIQILRCVRAHVEGFGTNQVVVVQYRLKKEGPNPSGAPPYEKDKFWPNEIKARDPVLGQAFKVWQPSEGNETYSRAKWTDEMKPGENGDGYVWLNIPDRVNTIDLFFPYTNPQRVDIEIPKAQ
jgi:hypothetical protein